MNRLPWGERFRTREIAVPCCETPLSTRIHGEPTRVGIQPTPGIVEVGAIFIGLATIEPRRFELQAAGEQSRREDAVGDVRRVLPVVAEGGEGVRFRGWAVREGDRAERRLAHRGEIKEKSEVSRYRSIVAG